jgi:hypothetical protein
MTSTPVATPTCWGMDPELFFPPVESSGGEEPTVEELRALRVCAACHVGGWRLAVALRHPGYEQHGVVDGLTAGQRRALLRTTPTHTLEPLRVGVLS